MSKPATTPPSLTPADRFRPIIEQAILAGVDLSQQELRLTHGDAARLKRDPTVGDDEITFRDGAMRFIGVRVVQGAPASGLAEAEVVPPAPATGELSAAKGQKKSNKEIRKPKAEKPKPAPAGRDFTTPPAKGR